MYAIEHTSQDLLDFGVNYIFWCIIIIELVFKATDLDTMTLMMGEGK